MSYSFEYSKIKMKKINIPLDRLKIFRSSFPLLIFIVVGIFLIIGSLSQDKHITYVFAFIFLVATIILSLFVIANLIKIFDLREGLSISDEGIYDNSSIAALGFIPWEDVMSINVLKINNAALISVRAKNPEKYMKRTNIFTSFIIKGNLKMSGTPITISVNNLKCTFEELEQWIFDRFEKNRIR